MNCIKWIKVGNDEPQEREKILLWIEGYGLDTGNYYKEYQKFVPSHLHGDYTVTHYAEINEPINY